MKNLQTIKNEQISCTKCEELTKLRYLDIGFNCRTLIRASTENTHKSAESINGKYYCGVCKEKIMEKSIFFHRCPTEDTVEVIILMNKEKLEDLYYNYRTSNIGNNRLDVDFCLNIIKEIYYEAKRGFDETNS